MAFSLRQLYLILTILAITAFYIQVVVITHPKFQYSSDYEKAKDNLNVSIIQSIINNGTFQTDVKGTTSVHNGIPPNTTAVNKISDMLESPPLNRRTDEQAHRRYGNSSSGIKTILYWTTCFGRPCQYGDMGERIFQTCEHKSCNVTYDKSLLSTSSLVVFHQMDSPDFPAVRYTDQLYLHFTFDPPWPIADDMFLKKYEDKINITGSYLRDANIYIPYGELVAKENNAGKKTRLMHTCTIVHTLWRTRGQRKQYRCNELGDVEVKVTQTMNRHNPLKV